MLIKTKLCPPVRTIIRRYAGQYTSRKLIAGGSCGSARSRARRKKLLESRQSVLADDEVELWKSATVDLMSDEEDGVVGGVSGWIVRPPSFCRPDLSELCVKLQSRLEATPKYRATHSRRLHNGPASERMPPVTYNPNPPNANAWAGPVNIHL
ncbi:uncharacterized protein C14orf93-like [Fundulus heteroclitus]|uniref:uncharacterized protein C14orf93-like n=1 Tax=Fundulus heteroclitus TaxID=8078 RepID=UPI00165A8720|nr:uncharacterized protein C14orf93-like [Fundulus heteroclitus]